MQGDTALKLYNHTRHLLPLTIKGGGDAAVPPIPAELGQKIT